MNRRERRQVKKIKKRKGLVKDGLLGRDEEFQRRIAPGLDRHTELQANYLSVSRQRVIRREEGASE